MGMLKSFGDRTTKDIYEGRGPKGVSSQLLRPIRIGLNLIATAHSLTDLRNPPSNNLESIKSLPGMYSIRVNQKYRIVFRWQDGNAEDVIICDYKH
jgi:proteic killer suppression protein